MNTMRMLFVIAGLSVGAPALQAAEAPSVADQPAATSGLLDRLFPTSNHVRHPRPMAGHIRPHDVAHPVVRVAHADAHERASAGVQRAHLTPKADRDVGSVRLAVLDRSGACDSILCPGYSMLGVGF